VNGMDFARPKSPCQQRIRRFVCENFAEVVVKWVPRRGCAHEIPDVHYLGLELSELGRFQVGREPKIRHAASDQKSRLWPDGSEVPGRAEGR